MQLAPLVENTPGWKLFHLRSAQNQEIDFVLERSDGDLVAVEVKR